MQDNLDFLQWTKRYWDQYFPGHDYDAVARRKGSGGPTATTTPSAALRTSTASSSRRPQTGGAAASTTTTTNRTAPRATGTPNTGSAGVLRAENETLKEAIAGLEKERDFYFSKLRDIELLLQTAVDQDPELEKDDNGLVKNIQAILYSTEEGFEIPAEAEGEGEGGLDGQDGVGGGGGGGHHAAENGDEQETF